jgi:hypothetical protein
MIGWIALAGIIVRNSILLVDFSIHAIRRGVSVEEAVIQACKTRTRPIMITALALVAGSSVILGDPIFKGMAISLAFGVMVSTVLTLVVIPLGCVNAEDSLRQMAFAAPDGSPGSVIVQPPAAPADTHAPPALAAARERAEGIAAVAGARITAAIRSALARVTRLASGLRGKPPATAPEAPAARPRASGRGQPTERPAAGHPAAGVRPSRAAPEPPAPTRRTAAPATGESRAAVRPLRGVAGRPTVAANEPLHPPEPEPPRATVPAEGPPPRAPAGRPALSAVPSSPDAARKAGAQRKRRGIRLKADMPGMEEDPQDAERG